MSGVEYGMGVEGFFSALWNNPPKPFNPDYIDGAKKAWTDAIRECEPIEDAHPEWGNEDRAKLRRETYERILHDRGLRPLRY